MTRQTLNMRFIATGGILKGVLKPDEQVTQQEMLTPTGEDEAPTEQKRIDLDFTPIMGVMFFRQLIRIFDWLLVFEPDKEILKRIVL